ncbi:uncharacterized protein LOC119990425 [Tripterygium wilfordii]|uniref:uncharacterized protein LOC119990425 n=1 Tax=Tripterygium wilfordii TaxID=458696 RepID=UPI0018F8338D|nr:uncharacterized protein LOC119990425 [Tripterygium wilfordii]
MKAIMLYSKNFNNFWKFVYSTKVNPSTEDKICWNLTSNKLFSVSSFYNELLKDKLHLGNSGFPWRWIWKSKAPPRVTFFCWEVVWGRILTMDNLQRRGITLASAGFRTPLWTKSC